MKRFKTYSASEKTGLRSRKKVQKMQIKLETEIKEATRNENFLETLFASNKKA